MLAIVYQATNKVNGHRYAGVTLDTLKHRRYEHWCDARANRTKMPIHAALRKYGLEAFDWIIIRTFTDYKEALQFEIDFIAETKPEYNVTRGGQGIVGMVRNAEWNRRISDSLKRRVMSDKEKEQSRNNIKAAQEKNKKQIVCLNDGEIYSSVRDAAKYYGMGSRLITEVLSGRMRCSGGKYFAYARDVTGDHSVLISEIESHRATTLANRGLGHARAVRREPDGVIFPSATAAAAASGVTKSLVGYLCRNGKVNTAGFRFSYIEQPKHRSSGGAPGKPVKCLNDGNEYPSSAAAAIAYGIDASSINSICNRVPKAYSVHGLVFRFVGDTADVPDLTMIGDRRIMRPVVCCADGKRYDSIGEAAAAYGVSLSAVSAVLCGKAETSAGGRVFRYADDPRAAEIVPIRTDRVHTKKVICENDGIVYESTSAAARAYGADFRHVSAVALGKQRTTRGLVFRYI